MEAASSRDRKRKAEEAAGEAEEAEEDVEELEEEEGEDSGEEAGEGEEESSGESVDEAELWKKYGPGLVQTRTKRATAGKRMNALLEQEDQDDDFYRTTYGEDIFNESNSEFHSSDEEDESGDACDSDFLTDDDEPAEADAGAGAAEAEAQETKAKKKNVYVDPLKKQKKSKKSSASTARSVLKELETSKGYMPKSTATQRKSARSNTAEAQEKRARRVELVKKPAKVRAEVTRVVVPRMTMEQRLAEALETEKYNLETLNKYRVLEAEKKKTVLRKSTYSGHIITYLSTTRTEDGAKVARNYLTFSDSKHFIRRHFPGAAIKKPAPAPAPAAQTAAPAEAQPAPAEPPAPAAPRIPRSKWDDDDIDGVPLTAKPTPAPKAAPAFTPAFTLAPTPAASAAALARSRGPIVADDDDIDGTPINKLEEKGTGLGILNAPRTNSGWSLRAVAPGINHIVSLQLILSVFPCSSTMYSTSCKIVDVSLLSPP
eukprot:m.75525 g.75525  ORF g.75525 m.75525 type:complete len:487 (-) comp13136_c2_seq2:259-1719(-)